MFDRVLPMRSTSAQGHAMALKAGTDMACTEYSGHLNESLAQARTSPALTPGDTHMPTLVPMPCQGPEHVNQTQKSNPLWVRKRGLHLGMPARNVSSNDWPICTQLHSIIVCVQGLVSAADIDAAAGRVLAAKFRLGVFDAPEQVPFSAIPASAIGSDAHLALALEAAQKSASHALLNSVW